MRKIFILLISVVIAAPSHAETLYQLRKQGYVELWSGFAAITTCVHDRDQYKLGGFVFLCDQYTYEYPYHYGDVAIVATEFEYQGTMHIIAKLCLGDDRQCIDGTLLRR